MHRKARMDQRSRERLPVLPVLVRTANDRRMAAARLLSASQATGPGEVIDDTDRTLRKTNAPKATGRIVWAEDVATGATCPMRTRRRSGRSPPSRSCGSPASCEELLELSHHSITEYPLPGTGELVPLLQIVPSTTDTERLLLVSPELADVLRPSSRVCVTPTGPSRRWVAYDVRERIWHPPMPLLFQRGIGNERRAFTPSAIRKLLINALAATGLADASGDPLLFQAHGFRRIFVTDAIMNGLPPHIAQIICGHQTIQTQWDTKPSIPPRLLKPIEPSLPAAGAPGRPKNIAPRPTRNGILSLPTSRKGRYRLAPPRERSDQTVFTSTLAMRCSSYGRTRRIAPDSKRSATIWSSALSRPNVKAGSAESKASKCQRSCNSPGGGGCPSRNSPPWFVT